jgi:anaerobic magnesium-protoporphyrin IX monomethyl ester cyclase
MHVALVGPDLEENLSIRYLSGALKAAGHASTIVPFDKAEDLERTRSAVRDSGANLVALSMCYQIRAPEFLKLADALKVDAPRRPIVAGGHYASCVARELLEHHRALDVVAIHEGERTLVELASIPDPTPEALRTIRGIVFRTAEGIVSTPARGIVADLDALPWPDRSGPARLVVGVPSAYMMGSRGCVATCDYCAITTLHRLAPGKRFRQRDPEKIAEEMGWLYHERGVRQFVFHDDNFLVPRVSMNLRRVEALDRALRRRGVRRIGLVLKCRPADVHPQVFRHLREMGLLRVFLGIESGTAEGLASIGRRQTVAEADRALEVCEKLDISSQYTVIIFHPEATPRTMLADLEFVRRHMGHPLSFCRAEVYAGTPLERRMLEASRARGSYLGRTYAYTDPTTELIWSAGRELLAERCWSQTNLLCQVIQLDHLAAVYRHFYEGKDVDALVSDFLAWELEVNRDSVDLFEELIEACIETPDADAPRLQRRLAELRERGQAATQALMQRACAFREALRSQSYRKIGLAPTKPVPPRSAGLFSRIPRHAAAAILALGLGACGGGGGKEDSGVIEAPPPPYDSQAIEDSGVIEAPPPPLDLGPDLGPDAEVKEDGGVIEAPPPPWDSGTP